MGGNGVIAKILKFTNNFIVSLNNVIKYLYFYFVNHQYACEIKEFDLQKKEVVIYCYGVRIITIKSTIAEIVGDPNIIVNLPPFQSCWLGYYYGKLCAQSSDGAASFQARGGGFLLRFTRGRFKIFSFDRENMLIYIDVKTKKSYKESPLVIAQNKFIIRQFDSSQACYIGILAGLMVAKQGEQIIKVHKRPVFTVVK
ncbi:MAG: hypothetical protein A3E87_06515 [Gammaproteobacteria bacterium RIFCSPHIGHO2_12_FULL_35_23]|nr:MAG: hypothetical protein A3E87_06515 [Gammaproteobacteria bacterium RIFCSPHIGHO2_12_FULL_35_23]